MASDALNTLLKLSPAIPIAGIAALTGYLKEPKKQDKLERAARYGYTGLTGGSGLALGANIGHSLAGEGNKPLATVLGGLVGGGIGTAVGQTILGKSEAQRKQEMKDELLLLLREELSKQQTRPQYVNNIIKTSEVSPTLKQLLLAKKLSDERKYKGKHQKLYTLIERNPKDFYIDSRDPRTNIVGLTWRPGNFKIHAPSSVLPTSVKLQDLSNERIKSVIENM